MPAVVCPHCYAKLRVYAEDMGGDVECSACQKAFTAPLPVAHPVHDDAVSAEDLIHHAKSECVEPGIGMIAIGALSTFTGLATAVFGGMPLFGGPVNNRPITGWTAEETAALYLAFGFYMAATGAFQVFAGRQMMKARQYALCWVACIMAVIPVVSPCVLGIIVGFRGINKLRDPWVTKGFTANRPGYDPDTAT